jgi:HAE1 family hydrophobic/amphiphilic exporter-1
MVNFNSYGMRWRDPAFLNASSFDEIPEEFKRGLTPSGANLFDYNVSVSQPLYTAGKVGAALQLAKLEREGVAIDVARVEQEIRIQVVRAFYGLLLAEKQVEVARDTVRQRERHLENVRNRFQAGVATEVDVLRSQVSLANARPDLLRAENGVRYARSVLNNLLARPTEFATQAAGELAFKGAEQQALPQVVEDALSGRPEMLRLKINEREAETQRKLAHAESRLRADFSGQYGFSFRDPANIVKPDFVRWMFTFTVSLPLFDGGRRDGMVAQAVANQRMAKLARDETEDAVHLQAQTALDELRRANLTVESAQASVQEAERVLGMMEQNYRFGAATTLDVQDSQTSVALARMNLFQSLYDHTVARAQVRYVMGLDPLGE